MHCNDDNGDDDDEEDIANDDEDDEGNGNDDEDEANGEGLAGIHSFRQAVCSQIQLQCSYILFSVRFQTKSSLVWKKILKL